MERRADHEARDAAVVDFNDGNGGIVVRGVNGKQGWTVVAIVAVMVAACASAQGAASAQGVPHSLKAVIEAVVQKGADNQLPAHLSLVLGINKSEQATAVKQAVVRTGSIVRTLNVVTANHGEVVLIVYDEQSRMLKAYLSSVGGKLLKAIAYQAGAAPTQRSVAEARGDFANEFKFWTEPARTAGVGK